ncbi:hypothetical protein WA026_003534 [Henosepilachna vigintioctopunctata]|uniref:Gustatory receptor n=1 Tax=Henosepilachna vigintioctopunctata TaxID=420089 RepID=A0AAW1THM6_9CUCU
MLRQQAMTNDVTTTLNHSCHSNWRREEAVGQWGSFYKIYISNILVGLSSQYWFVPELTHYSPYDGGMYEVIHIHFSASAIYSVLMLYRRAEMFIEACKIITNVDKVLNRRHLNTSLALIRKIAYIPFITPMCFTVFIYRMLQNDAILSNFWLSLFSEYQCFVIPLAVHGYSLYYFCVFGHIIHHRLKVVNEYLKEIKLEDNLKIIEQEIVTFSKVHSDLCKTWEIIANIFGWPVTSLHLFTYMLITCFALRQLAIAFQTLEFEVFLYPILTSILVFWSILVGELIQNEAVNTGPALSELLEVKKFQNSNIISMVKTFHLQLLHRNFSIVLCGFFSLSIEHFGGALKSITNLIMFIIQMKGSRSQ